MANVMYMAPVTAAELVAGEPLSFNLYLANGVPLANRGQIVMDPERLEILLRQGWRGFAPEEHPPATAIAAEEAALHMDRQAPAGFRAQPRPPLTHALALVADDMALSIKLLGRLLREQGISRILAAENGRQAINLFFRQRPHLTFLDIDMPGLDGIDALKQIKSWSPETFVCLVSGNATMVNVKVAKTYGVDAFLVKPISGLNLQRVLALYGAGVAPTA